MNQTTNTKNNQNAGVMDNLKKVAISFSGSENNFAKTISEIKKLRAKIDEVKLNYKKDGEPSSVKDTTAEKPTKPQNKVFIPREQNGGYNGQRNENPRFQNRGYQGTNPRFNNNQNPRFQNGENPRYQGNNSGYQGTNPRYANSNGYQGNSRFGNSPRPQRPQSLAEKVLGKNDLKDNASVLATEKRDFSKSKDTSKKYEDKSVKSKKTLIKMGYIQVDDSEERMGSRRYKQKKNKVEQTYVAPQIDHAIIDTPNLTVKILSEKIGKTATEIIKKFMILGIMVSINSSIDFDAAELVAGEFGITLELKLAQTSEEKLIEQVETDIDNSKLVKRAPVVTIMGHVDHGKTSLLDTIRRTNVVSGEAGGITQHIGAYTIEWKNEKITFIDTPGHAAFTAMRARGAKVTDVAILVVAADDGIMPQTAESIKLIKDAKIPMIVAINKIDKPTANIERVMQQLTEYEVVPEEWGGDTVIVPISAKQNFNIDKHLEMIFLVSEVKDLKADPTKPGNGSVIEAKLDTGRGPVATVLVENGSIKVGDTVVCGLAVAKVKALIDDKGKRIRVAGPSVPVEILGFNETPNAGDLAYVVDEKFAKQLLSERKAKIKENEIKTSVVSVNDFLNTDISEEKKIYNIIIKGDVKGSVEALRESLVALKNEEVKVVCVSSGVGAITENDISMAEASNSVIIAFNIKTNAKLKSEAEHQGIKIEQHNIIYTAVESVQNEIDAMLTPKFEEKPLGEAEVRMVFKLSSVGMVAGSYVLSGKVQRNAKARVVRDGKVIADSSISTLKIQKNDVKEVTAGFECGIKLADVDVLCEGDKIQVYTLEQIKRK